MHLVIDVSIIKTARNWMLQSDLNVLAVSLPHGVLGRFDGAELVKVEAIDKSMQS